MAYYVKIEKPKELRKDLLLGSKELIEGLKRYHKIILLREERKKKTETLQNELKEIRLLLTRINKLLPEKQILQEERKKETKPRKQTTSRTRKKEASEKKEEKPLTEQDRLDHTLAMIEKKIKKL